MNKDEALKMAIEEIESPFEKWRLNCVPQVGFTAEIRELMALAFKGGRQSALESQGQEPVAWMKSALDNARDVCKYLDHDMIKEAKAHTKFFWNDLDKIRDFDNTHPAPSWQGLTAKEIASIPLNEYTVQTVERMLKEKNHD